MLKHAVKFRRVDDPEAEAEVKIIFNIALDRNGSRWRYQKLMEFISDETVLEYPGQRPQRISFN